MKRRPFSRRHTTSGIGWILSQYWPLIAVGAVFSLLISRGRKRQREAMIARSASEAQAHEMGYAAPERAEDSSLIDAGTHRFSGTTDGVAWVAEVVHLASEVADGNPSRRRMSLNYTRWTATEAATEGGALLLMPLPDGVSAPEVVPGAPGFLAAIAAKAAWVALQVYLRGNFGATRANALSLGPEHRIPLAPELFGTGYFGASNQPRLLERFTGEAAAYLRGPQGRGAALLWDSQGLTLTWQMVRPTAADVADRATFGAALVVLLSAVDRSA